MGRRSQQKAWCGFVARNCGCSEALGKTYWVNHYSIAKYELIILAAAGNLRHRRKLKSRSLAALRYGNQLAPRGAGEIADRASGLTDACD